MRGVFLGAEGCDTIPMREIWRISPDRRTATHGVREFVRSCTMIMIFCAILMFAVVYTVPTMRGKTVVVHRIYIGEDGYHYEVLSANPGDTVKVEAKVAHGSRMDIYILEQYDYIDNYSKEKEFSPVFVKEKKSDVDDTWDQPDDRGYYLIIENKDNPRDSDAVPDGQITVDYSVDNHYEERIVIEFMTCVGIVIGVSVVGVVCIKLYYQRKIMKNRTAPPAPVIHIRTDDPSMSAPFRKIQSPENPNGRPHPYMQWESISETSILEKSPSHPPPPLTGPHPPDLKESRYNQGREPPHIDTP